MILLSANNAQTTLANGISASTLTIVLAAGAGALFPSPVAGQYFTLTLNDALTQNNFEICYCTARTGDSLTVSRGQEGTSAQPWLIGDFAYNTLTAGSFQAALAAATLGFTPVQQGGGALQGTNKIFMGWDGADGLVRVQVDSTDMGGLAFESWVSGHFLALAGNQTVTGPVNFSGGLAATTFHATAAAQLDSTLTVGNTLTLGNGLLTTTASTLNLAGATVQITNAADTALAPLNVAHGITGDQAVSIAQFQFSSGGVVGWPAGGGTNPGAQVQMQFGTFVAPADSTVHSYALPTSFPNACLAVIVSYGGEIPPSAGAIGAQPQDANSFVATNTAHDGSNGCYFMAIGF